MIFCCLEIVILVMIHNIMQYIITADAWITSICLFYDTPIFYEMIRNH